MTNRIVIGIVTALAAFGLYGCGKHDTSTTTMEGPPVVAEPATPTTTKPAAGETENAGLIIRVLQEDSDTGVAADITRIDDADKSHHVASVDDSGIARIKQPCQEGDRFAAEPRVEAFLSARPQPCASTITFRLYAAKATYALIQLADNAARKGNFLLAQSNYGLAAERLQYAKPQEAQKLELLAAAAAGKVLGVNAPTAVVGGEQTVSPQMTEKLKALQRSLNIPVTGTLDAETRMGIDQRPPALLLHDAAMIQSTQNFNPQLQQSTVDVAAIQATQPTPATQQQSIKLRQRVGTKK